MKTTAICLLMMLTLSMVSQNKSTLSDIEDLNLRKVLSAKFLKENIYDYKSGEAKAMHNLIFKAFEKTSSIIILDQSNISNIEDKANLNSLIQGLNTIQLLTPNWKEIINLEKNALLLQDKQNNRVPHLIENK